MKAIIIITAVSLFGAAMSYGAFTHGYPVLGMGWGCITFVFMYYSVMLRNEARTTSEAKISK